MKKYYFEDGNSKNQYDVSFYVDERTYDYNTYKQLATQWPYFHECFEIMLIESDDLSMTINEKTYLLQHNDLVIYSPDDFHRYILEKDEVYRRLTCTFSCEYIEKFGTSETDLLRCFRQREPDFCPIRRLNDSQAAAIAALILQAGRVSKSNEYGSDVATQCILTRILIYANQLFADTSRALLDNTPSEYEKLRPVITYINQNLNEELTIQTLARHFFISERHLCRLFKKYLGYTVNEYVTSRRVMQAAALLRDGKSVAQTCEAVTPEGESHFIGVFKKLVGTTPKQYAMRFNK